MSQEKGTDNLYKRPGYIFILSLPLTRGARHSLRIKSFYFTAANIRTISLTSKQIPHFFSAIRPFFLPNPPPSKKNLPGYAPFACKHIIYFLCREPHRCAIRPVHPRVKPVSNPLQTCVLQESPTQHLHYSYTLQT